MDEDLEGIDDDGPLPDPVGAPEGGHHLFEVALPKLAGDGRSFESVEVATGRLKGLLPEGTGVIWIGQAGPGELNLKGTT